MWYVQSNCQHIHTHTHTHSLSLSLPLSLSLSLSHTHTHTHTHTHSLQRVVEMAEELRRVREDEKQKRHTFSSSHHHHFLISLFPQLTHILPDATVTQSHNNCQICLHHEHKYVFEGFSHVIFTLYDVICHMMSCDLMLCYSVLIG